MYYALGTAICLAVLFLVMAAAFTLCMAVPRLLRLMSNSVTPRSCANFLFGIRMMPLLLGLAATLGFALPAFLRFEPRSTGEPMALRLLALALLGGLALLAMAVRAVRIARATIIAQRQWRRNSRKIRSEEHTSELQSLRHLVCRLLLEKKKQKSPTEAAEASRP